MKKTIAMILVISIFLASVACGETLPTTAPTTDPSTVPTSNPTTAPTTQPTVPPTTEPTTAPTAEPTNPPTDPTVIPTMDPDATLPGEIQTYAGVAYLTVNPSFAVYFNASGEVLKVEALNDDAAELLTDFNGYEGFPCAAVLASLVEAVGEAGYLENGAEISISIEPVEDGELDETFAATLQTEVNDEVTAALSRNEWDAEVTVEHHDKPQGPHHPGPGKPDPTDPTDPPSPPTDPTEPTAPPTTPTEPTVPTDPSHEHDYRQKEVVNATCIDDGYTIYECSCGSYYADDFVESLGHDYRVVVVDPTTESEGYTDHICDRCGYSYKDNYVAKLENKLAFTDVDDVIYVVSFCSVFAEPNTRGTRLGEVHRGDSAQRTGISEDGKWSRILYNGEVGYISNTYISTTPPETEPPTEDNGWDGHTYADPDTGISWDGVSPILYYYEDGTTGYEPREGAKYEWYPGVWITYHEPVVSDRCCSQCGKPYGDGRNGTCLRKLMVDWTCEHCGTFVKAKECHTCPED